MSLDRTQPLVSRFGYTEDKQCDPRKWAILVLHNKITVSQFFSFRNMGLVVRNYTNVMNITLQMRKLCFHVICINYYWRIRILFGNGRLRVLI